MSNERVEFSKRLAVAMRAMGFEARPSVLLARFNSYYRGPSVTFQTASRWLKGKSFPEQDKLVLLAELFKADPQSLRFGAKGPLEVREPLTMWPDRVSLRDQSLFEGFLALPTKQRELVRDLVEALSEALRKQKPD